MFDILLLLPISRWFFEGSNHKGGCGGYDGDGSLTILDGEFDGHTETFLKPCQILSGVRMDWETYPITCRFGNVFANFLR